MGGVGIRNSCHLPFVFWFVMSVKLTARQTAGPSNGLDAFALSIYPLLIGLTVLAADSENLDLN